MLFTITNPGRSVAGMFLIVVVARDTTVHIYRVERSAK
jgi:hypothetical protein